MSNRLEQLDLGGPIEIPGPYVRLGMLRNELASYRDAAGKTQVEVAAKLECSESKVLRIENGPALPDYPMLVAMLAFYGYEATDDTTKRLAGELSRIKQLRTNMRSLFSGLPPDQRDFEDHERYARKVLVYEPFHVPEAFLPDSYAEAGRREDDSVARRRAHLLGPGGPEVCFIVEEGAIFTTAARQPRGLAQSPTALDDLIGRLNAVNTRGQETVDPTLNPNISVQVVSLKYGATPLTILQRPAVWMHFPDDTIEPRGYLGDADKSEFKLVRPGDSVDLSNTLGVTLIDLGRRFEATIARLPGPEETEHIMEASRERRSS